MKKAFALALLPITATAATAMDISTAGMLADQARTFSLEDGVKVTVTRTGETRNVRVEQDGLARSYKIEPVDGKLQITGTDAENGTLVPKQRITVDGVELFEPIPLRRTAHYWVCPKDETMLRIPHSNHDGNFRCPVDGTPMKAAVGRSGAYFLLQ